MVSWPEKLLARKDFDDRQKGTLMGMLVHYGRQERSDPDEFFKVSEQQIKRMLYSLLQDAAASGVFQPCLTLLALEA